MTELEILMKEVAELREDLNRTKEQLARQGIEAERTEDYRKIMNAMMAHGFCYEGHAHEYELERFWSKTMPDISYNGYYGQEGARAYYSETPESILQSQREIVRRVYGAEVADDECVGYHAMNMVCSPYIEIAGDGNTAQGVWMEFSIRCHLDENAEPVTSVGTAKCACDFIKEDGEWKIWHAAYGVGQGFGLDVKLTNVHGPDDTVEPMTMKLPYSLSPEQAKRYGARRRKGMPMGMEMSGKPPEGFAPKPWGGSVTYDPKLPEPYETWDPLRACTQFEDD